MNIIIILNNFFKYVSILEFVSKFNTFVRKTSGSTYYNIFILENNFNLNFDRLFNHQSQTQLDVCDAATCDVCNEAKCDVCDADICDVCDAKHM